MERKVEILQEPIAALAEHARISIAYEVRSVLECEVRDGGLGGFVLTERAVAEPYVKDYDALDDGGPAGWARRFDVSGWGLLAAHVDGVRVGGAVVALDSVDVEMLEGRRDLAVLWDLRVAPEMRGRGVGAALFRAAAVWARARGCRRLKVETQNANVPACRFYAAQGCELGAIHRFAYPTLPHEVQMLWYLDLTPGASI